MHETPIRLTAYSHGAGCGCKLSPAVLHGILSAVDRSERFPGLLVGNETKDDAAVVDLGDGTGIITTTDFFMPIVDDPRTFGRIAAANAISDIYAMGGTPLVAIAILGWPLDKLPEHIAGEVVDGGRSICSEAGIPLAGGHSIDCPEPIFGLAVTGRVALDRLKRNDTGQPGDLLFLTKPLGVGILTTAEKRGIVAPEDHAAAVASMQRLNTLGPTLAALPGVHSLTDVTGFGLLGHLLEMAEGSGCGAELEPGAVPTLHPAALATYHAAGAVPGGARRNWSSYSDRVESLDGFARDLLSDPQTSGGLLIAASPAAAPAVQRTLRDAGLPDRPIGRLTPPPLAGTPTIRFV
ncbi:MAG: selenide, water dikinase SelD [Flavobacteriales bacterium]|jgi:selenide,water dikinase